MYLRWQHEVLWQEPIDRPIQTHEGLGTLGTVS